MREHGFRWAVVMLTNCEPTRQAVKVGCVTAVRGHVPGVSVNRWRPQAVATLMPRVFLEFLRTEEVSDWAQDRPGVDYGPRWLGDAGIRVEQQREREKLVEMLQETVAVDPELEKLMPKYPDEAARKPRRKRKETRK
jgi:hypothetical protein